MNYYILLTGLTIGLAILIRGLYNYWKFRNANEIISFKLSQENIKLYLQNGRYTVSVLGGGDVKSLPISLISEVDNKKIDVYKNALQSKFIKDGKFGVDYCNFRINIAGNYTFNVKFKNVSAKHTVPLVLSSLAEEISPDHLSIIVKQYRSPFKYIGSLILCFIGLGLALLSISFILYNWGIFN
ncbi:MAG: hypothetical protein DI539_02075 [Flavobacterium psychrophilum]|nr:MAG: hypothetical protein DI539_02075 [Flavobacterium psychrophilum]